MEGSELVRYKYYNYTSGCNPKNWSICNPIFFENLILDWFLCYKKQIASETTANFNVIVELDSYWCTWHLAFSMSMSLLMPPQLISSILNAHQPTSKQEMKAQTFLSANFFFLSLFPPSIMCVRIQYGILKKCFYFDKAFTQSICLIL